MGHLCELSIGCLYFRQELDPSLEEFGLLFGKENEVTGLSSVLFSNKEHHEIAHYYLHIWNPKCNNDCLEKEGLVYSVVKKEGEQSQLIIFIWWTWSFSYNGLHSFRKWTYKDLLYFTQKIGYLNIFDEET